ncbi:uncharacterized protein LOC141626874 [Silene latifolia]|uniref:uncharacterized protein LOC141626874 n=1 Tax=Silene latifolia TaxID=37657 RepID=UPI003D77A16D
MNSGTIKQVVDLFFEYSYNNALHHHVESIICSCLENGNDVVIEHLFEDCDLIKKILDANKHPILYGYLNLCNSIFQEVESTEELLSTSGLSHVDLLAKALAKDISEEITKFQNAMGGEVDAMSYCKGFSKTIPNACSNNSYRRLSVPSRNVSWYHDCTADPCCFKIQLR